MLESILNPNAVEKRPYEMFFLAVAVGFVATLLALMIGRGTEVSHLLIAFICISVAPLIVNVLTMEEERDEDVTPTGLLGLLPRHKEVIEIYGYLFLGLIVSISLIYAFLPADVAASTFDSQASEISIIQGMATGRAINSCDFMCLAANNLGVLGLTLLFSVIFGAGALYVIAWNASIVGVLIGMIARTTAATSGQSIIGAYLIALPISLLRLFPHGIFEVGAYFMAGISGGILSAAVVRGQLSNKRVLQDVAIIAVLSVLMIVIGAVIESSY